MEAIPVQTDRTLCSVQSLLLVVAEAVTEPTHPLPARPGGLAAAPPLTTGCLGPELRVRRDKEMLVATALILVQVSFRQVAAVGQELPVFAHHQLR